MTIQRLSRLSDWRLKDKEQDLCGKILRAQNGQEVGRVIDMVVDTEAGLVTSVVMQDDTHVATEDIDLRDGQIWLSDVAHQPLYESRQPERFVPGEREADVEPREFDERELDELEIDMLEMDMLEDDDSQARDPDEINSTRVHVYRDSSTVREKIRQALEEHKRERPNDPPPRPRR